MEIELRRSKPKGTIFVSGNKNSALPVIAASILHRGKVTLHNIPNIIDVNLFLDFLRTIGVVVDFKPKQEILHLDYSKLRKQRVLRIPNPDKLTKIRAVILLLAALAVRFDKVVFKGRFTGCSLGSRPLTVHFNNLEAMGFKVVVKPDALTLTKPRQTRGKKDIFVWQAETSVTATEVALIVAMAHRGKTTIYNAASEPHVQDTASFLKLLGARVRGIGTNLLEIDTSFVQVEQAGQPKHLKYAIYSDIHEYATWLGISAITGGRVEVVHNISPFMLQEVDRHFKLFGYNIKHQRIDKPGQGKHADSVIKLTRKNLTSTRSAEHKIWHIKKASAITHVVKNLTQGIFKSTIVKPRTSLRRPPVRLDNGYIKIKPAPWPGLLVDILSLFVPLAAYSDIPVVFHNWMYDGGLFWTLQLRKAGVSVVMADPHRVIIKKLPFYRQNVTLEAPYIIRATIAMIMFGLTLEHVKILSAEAAFRGHPYFIEKLRSVGVNIEITKE